MAGAPLPTARCQLCKSKTTRQREQRDAAWPRGREPQPLTVSLGRQLHATDQHTNLLLLQKCQASASRVLLKMRFIPPPALPGFFFFF